MRLLMCPPTHFDVHYEINPWMDVHASVDLERARDQWQGLVDRLRAAGATIELIEPAPGLADMVFTANAGVVDGERFIPARLRHAERRGERAHFEAWFQAHGYELVTLPDGVQEGAGDALRFASTLVAGHRIRTDATGLLGLARAVDAPLMPAEMIDPRLYHLDLAFCPLDDKHAMLAPSAFAPQDAQRLAELVAEPLLLDVEEALSFCANSIVVGRTVIMPACPPRLARELEARGFEPVVVEVDEFLKAGGGPRCMTLRLDVALSAEVDAQRPSLRAAREGAAAAGLAERYAAHNYHPLPVTVARGEGAWVWDTAGQRYLDALSAYSALNFGHRHPRLLAAAREQLDRLTLTSRAFHNDQLGPFCQELAEACGQEMVLLMNTGAEAVESAIKVARKWGYEAKGVPKDKANIVACHGNFHGRTTTIVSFSDDPEAREGFGPYTPGFRLVAYGDVQALADAIDEHTVAFLVEPVQGEAGVILPPLGYLRAARQLCDQHDVLLIADEIQSGLGRTGRTFACEHSGTRPDLMLLGKALGGGIVPVSAVVGREAVLGVLQPGQHGSTFGGNPLACAVGRQVLRLLAPGTIQSRAAEQGRRLEDALIAAAPVAVEAVRVHGLWAGLDIAEGFPAARHYCEELMRAGVLAKDAHERTIRLAPPLVMSGAELNFLAERLLEVLASVPALASGSPGAMAA